MTAFAFGALLGASLVWIVRAERRRTLPRPRDLDSTRVARAFRSAR